MYVGIYVCFYVCMCVCVHIRIYVCLYVCMYLYSYVCMCLYSYVCRYICMSVCFYVCICGCMYICMYVCIYYICVYVYMYVYICIYVCMYVCMYLCMYVCVDVRMYVCMYVHIDNTNAPNKSCIHRTNKPINSHYQTVQVVKVIKRQQPQQLEFLNIFSFSNLFSFVLGTTSIPFIIFYGWILKVCYEQEKLYFCRQKYKFITCNMRCTIVCTVRTVCTVTAASGQWPWSTDCHTFYKLQTREKNKLEEKIPSIKFVTGYLQFTVYM